MAHSPLLLRRIAASIFRSRSSLTIRTFRSDAALELIRKASESKTPNVVLYNYPSFSGSYGALFAHLYHSRLNLPCLILPFSSVAPFSVEDLCIEGMETCYFLDFLGPKGFASELSKRTLSKVVGFDHRKSVLPRISPREDSDKNIAFHVNLEKSSSANAYEYFSAKLLETRSDRDDILSLLNHGDRKQVEIILKYIEDLDLRRWSLPDIKAFNVGLREWGSKLNCITNSHMYQQLLQMCSADLITKGNTHLSCRVANAMKQLGKVFRVQLGRGFYGECLGVRADGNSEYSDEIGKELSRRSAAAGLRPIGAVIYMQRKNLKMCLRTTESGTDTSEVAKAYGGGGSPSSSSFIIRMDEYNQWISTQSSSKSPKSSSLMPKASDLSPRKRASRMNIASQPPG